MASALRAAGELVGVMAMSDEVRGMLPQPPERLFCPVAAQYASGDDRRTLMTDAVWDATAGRIVSQSALLAFEETRGHAVGAPPDQLTQMQLGHTRELATVFWQLTDVRARACDLRETNAQHKVVGAADALGASQSVPVVLQSVVGWKCRYIDLSVEDRQNLQAAAWAEKIKVQIAIVTEEIKTLEPRVVDKLGQLADVIGRAQETCPPEGKPAKDLKRLGEAVRKGGKWKQVNADLGKAVGVMETEEKARSDAADRAALQVLRESITKDRAAIAENAVALDRARMELESTKTQSVENMVLRWETIITRRVDMEQVGNDAAQQGAGWDPSAVAAFKSEEVKAIAQE